MFNLFKTSFKIRAATGANKWLYFIGRLPLIGRLLPQSIYAAGALKTILTALITVLREVGSLFTKLLYFFVLLVAASLLNTGEWFEGFGHVFGIFAHLLFWMSCFIPFFTDSDVLKASMEKYICIKFMRVPPRRYMMAEIPFTRAILFVGWLPGLLLCSVLAGGTVWQALALWVMLMAFRFAGEAFQLWCYKHFKATTLRKTAMVFVVVGLGFAGALLPLFLHWPLWPAALLVSWPGALCMLALLAACVWYVFWGNKNWRAAILANLKLEYIQPDQKAAQQRAFEDVQIQEGDLEDAPEHSARLQRKTGYAYFNALFFRRHRRLLLKPVFIRVALVALVLAAGLAWLFFAADSARRLLPQMVNFLPVFVFVMYAVSMAPKACKAMFYNCDNSMLRYPFYRMPKVLLRNFNIRLRYVAAYNLVVALAMCAAVLLLVGLAGGELFTLSVLAFCLSLLMLSVFFSVHHLFTYYVFQPYTTDLAVKNPFFRLLNIIIYAVSYACLQVQTADAIFAAGVLGVTMVYSAVALALVYKLSPRRFRVK